MNDRSELRRPLPHSPDSQPATRNSIAQRQRWIAIARGDIPADLVLKCGRVLSVFTGELLDADVAIADDHVVGVGTYAGRDEIDVAGKLLTPGFVDGHCHIESSKLSVHEFARAVLRCGTTTVVVDPHELANVLGVSGIDYVLEASDQLPLDVRVMIPSCVPASRFETPFQELRAEDFRRLMSHARVLGLAEMMNYPAVIGGESAALEKMAAFDWMRIDGHAPSVTGRPLNAYLVGGPSTDHECVSVEEALEKRRLGMWVMIREASMIRNLADLLPMVKKYGTDNTLFVSDDREADTLLHEGHVNAMVKLAVELGLSVGDAVKLASLNVARCHGLDRIGAIAPGYRADICVFPDNADFEPELVISGGRVAVERGQVVPFAKDDEIPSHVRDTVHISAVSAADFRLPMASGSTEIRVIDIVRDQVVTASGRVRPTTESGFLVADPDKDLAKLAVIERHHATGAIGLAFVRGFGLRRGALASTVAHDAHNLVVAGMSDEDMAAAVARIVEIGGGLVVADGGVVAEMPLPIAGLMSDLPAEEVDVKLRQLDSALADMGVQLATPFMYLGFLALSVIPELRLTDQGLVDVTAFSLVPIQVP